MDDCAFLCLSGLLDLVFCPLSLLLGDLLGFDCFEILFHECEIGYGEVIDYYVEVGGALGEEGSDAVGDLVSLGE